MSPSPTAWRRVPGSTRLSVDPTSGRIGRRLRTLAGTSDWRRDLLDRLGAAALTVAGASAMPPAPALPWPIARHEDLVDALSETLPGLRVFGAVTPRQPDRQRLSLHARMTGNHVVVKLGAVDGRLEREGQVLELLARDPLPGIATPTPLDRGVTMVADTEVSYLVTTALALGRQRPAIDAPLRTFEADLGARLATMPRPPVHDGEDDDLVPVHGDLTPWNLRRTSRGLALFDWESAGWGRRGSDLATYSRACDEVRPWWSRKRPA